MPIATSSDRVCGSHAREWLCHWVFDWTSNRTASDVARTCSPWVTILLIVVAAVVVNRLARRAVRRGARRWEQGGRFAAWRHRMPLRMLEATTPVPTLRRHQRAETIAAGIASFVTIFVWLVTIVWILAVLGVDAATLLTSAGLIGVALAFGAQNLLRDLIAGTFIIFEDQLGVGDVVDLDLASGTVEEVTLRTTRVRDVEGVVWHVPNGEIHRVGNKSQQWSRAVVDVPIAASADSERAREVIAHAAAVLANDPAFAPRILDAPEVLGIESFTLDSVTIRLVVKTAPSEQWRIARELRARIKTALDEAGIVAAPAAGDDPSAGAPG